MKKCGCKIVGPRGDVHLADIIFCPLHAVAGQMLSMLKHIEIHGLRGTGYADLKELIAKAEGHHE